MTTTTLPGATRVLLGLAFAGLLTAAAPGGPATADWPLRPPPAVLRGFDPPALRWLAGHRGVDLAAEAGQVVFAAADGVVGFAGTVAGRGVVAIRHDRYEGDGRRPAGLRTTYLPVDPTVEVGDRVTVGDPIGRMQPERTHCPGRVCLHWGLLRDGGPGAAELYLNPLSLLAPDGPVRLWPPTREGPDPDRLRKIEMERPGLDARGWDCPGRSSTHLIKPRSPFGFRLVSTLADRCQRPAALLKSTRQRPSTRWTSTITPSPRSTSASFSPS